MEKMSRNSGMALPIVTRFGGYLDTKLRCIWSWVGYICVPMCTRAGVPPFHISRMTGRIALKIGMWFEIHYLGVFQESK